MTSALCSCMTSVLTYETYKSVVVRSWPLGIMYRLAQLIIISYFVGYVFLYEKAYQVADTNIESSVTTKVKGFGKLDNAVMDVADYIYPPQGEGTFSIITKIIETDNQFQGRCPESEKEFNCSSNADCIQHLGSVQADGMITGECNTTAGYCEIEGWCPAEDDKVKMKPMPEFVNFTIYIKNSIRFPLFNVTRGNFNSTKDTKTCKYDKIEDPFCPIFQVDYILNETRQNVTTLADMGGEIGIIIQWRCNLDHDVNFCVPKYSFSQLDAPFQNAKLSKGYNFRFAKYYKTEDGTDYRRLHKAFAIRFDVIVTGTARKFSLIPTVINVITAVTSVGMGTVLCDLILLHCSKRAQYYKEKKYEEVSEEQINESLTPKPGSQLSVRRGNSSCNDSGAISLSTNF
ncbi:P2X purinoceptor 3a [Poecilia latipinna]|uniref:P2X purinoceptor 3a n=1 Tax=Poecilia latipinna TaxID=48699 RepID=UPI00072DDA69|nr:PREDICTED: P2X purinoceptor 3-like [Poecilia latipinna]